MGGKPFDLFEAAEAFYAEFPARRTDTIIAAVTATPDELRERMRGIFPYADRRFPKWMDEWLLRNASPSVKHLACDDDGIFHDPDLEEAEAFILLSPAGAPAGKTVSESILRDYFLRQSSLRAHYRNNQMVIPDEPGFRTDDYWLWKVFDHETGHVLFARDQAARQSGGQPHFEESVCDAYALIRHYQRFGADTGFDRALILNRARLIPDMGTPYARAHMTVACLEAVRAMDRAELMALTPQQSFSRAVKIAREHALSRELISQFCDAAHGARDLKNRELGPYYAKSSLPPVLVGDYVEALRVMQPH